MMTFNIASFLTFALALSSLDAVTAVSVPKSLDGGDLNKRDPQNVFVKFFDVPEGGFFTACGNFIASNDTLTVALPASEFAGGSHCNKSMTITFGQVSLDVTVTDLCDGCSDKTFVISQNAFSQLNGNSSAGLLAGILSVSFTPNY